MIIFHAHIRFKILSSFPLDPLLRLKSVEAGLSEKKRPLRRADFEFPGDENNNIPVVLKTLEKVHSTYTPSALFFYLSRFFK